MNPLVRVFVVSLAALATAVGLGSCADLGAAGASLGADAAAGPPDPRGRCGGFAVGEHCDRDTQCEPNLHCVLATPDADKMTCQPVSGRCMPLADPSRACFRGARCVAATGQCTFVPASPVFFATERELAVMGPDDGFSPRLQAGQPLAGGFSFRWERPRLRSDAITVVAAFNRPPRRSPVGNRIANIEDVVWVWTSDTAAEGGAQTADISAGRAGFGPNGSISPRRVTGLPQGRFFWMVFTLEAGVVTASSRPRSLSVLPPTGTLVATGTCDTESDCVAELGGVGESWACVEHTCLARCSSDLDCAPRGQRCELEIPHCGFRDIGRNGGHCVTPSGSTVPGDAGTGTIDLDAGTGARTDA